MYITQLNGEDKSIRAYRMGNIWVLNSKRMKGALEGITTERRDSKERGGPEVT